MIELPTLTGWSDLLRFALVGAGYVFLGISASNTKLFIPGIQPVGPGLFTSGTFVLYAIFGKSWIFIIPFNNRSPWTDTIASGPR